MVGSYLPGALSAYGVVRFVISLVGQSCRAEPLSGSAIDGRTAERFCPTEAAFFILLSLSSADK